jgi:hypothetical protein
MGCVEIKWRYDAVFQVEVDLSLGRNAAVVPVPPRSNITYHSTYKKTTSVANKLASFELNDDSIGLP